MTLPDLLKTCGSCGQRYWWTAQQRQDYRAQGLPAPTQCSNCCPEAVEYEDSDEQQFEDDQLMVSEPAWMDQLPQTVLTPDIEALVAEAFCDFEDRRRSFWEWLSGYDVRGAQMAKKLSAVSSAKALIQARRELVAEMANLFHAATDLRRQQLEAFLNEITLKERIVEKLALGSARIRTLQAEEESRRQRFLPQPTPLALPPPSHYEQVIGEHLEEVQAKSGARRAAIRACRAEVREIMDDVDLSHEETAYEVRAILDAYGLPDTSLPKDVQKFLAGVEEGGES